MHDQFHVLFDEVREEPLPAPFAPAGEIRRRGRLRSRRQALSAGVAVLAVLGLGAGGLAVAAGRTSTPPPVGDPAMTARLPTSSPAPAGPTPPSECELEPLPNPEGAYQSLVTGADPTGRFVVGTAYFTNGSRGRVVLWDGGQPVSVDIPGEEPQLHDVNSHGVAIGASYLAGDTTTGWVYQDGDLTELPAGYSPSTINEQGAIAGTLGSGAARERLAPVVWRSPTAEPEMLSVPGETWSVNANYVGSDGTVVGVGTEVNGDQDAIRSFIWSPDGVRQELPLPEASDGTAVGFAATSIRDGFIVGSATLELDGGNGVAHPAFGYDLATGEFTDLAGDLQIGAGASNSYGWVAGNTVDGLVLLAGGTAVTLPYPEVPEDPGDRFGNRPIVASVSEDGRTLAGQVHVDDGSELRAQAVTWRCR